jgi:hypothetical protein
MYLDDAAFRATLTAPHRGAVRFRFHAGDDVHHTGRAVGSTA